MAVPGQSLKEQVSNRDMKRTKIDVGICTLAVICLLGTTVFAVSEQFSTGNAGIRMFGKTELEAGKQLQHQMARKFLGLSLTQMKLVG